MTYNPESIPTNETPPAVAPPDLADAFDGYFRLAVGDLAVSREALARLQLELELNPERPRYDRIGSPNGGMSVLHRRLEQCHGGIQGFYGCRRWVQGADGNTIEAVVYFAEHELVPWAEAADVLRAYRPKDAPR